MSSLKTNQDIAFANGGSLAWKLATHGTDDYKTYRMTMSGRIHCDTTDFSYRHRKRLLANLVIELEALSEMELAWEEKQGPSDRDIRFENVRLRKLYSATSALHEYYDNADGGFMGRMERAGAICDRKRRHGSSSTVATEPDQQNDFQVTSTASTSHDNDDDDADNLQPKRKRRCKNVGVRFENAVSVRTEADVEALSRNAILQPYRSTGITHLTLTTENLKTHDILDLLPGLIEKPRPFRQVIPLKTHDGAPQKLKRRFRVGHQPGKWTMRAGWEFVDTSGWRTR
ncbi:hypothetical protein L13192_07384 [Pyrenophora tritici-repentis]|uniref:Uncharacterized protein n=2 Tax=Pyrenophora tritici-repentis TaxID=45151 RepID=A0A922N9J0_9PLEO|nr:uncharacterized protein PTRG_04661 [Pyrenophora tritici-repentis Pt-1C-BFP]EDU47568.1 predicted protein [Pyrenophora tritici-repentis Pt-1C-BFP]KAI1511020.1 hypothetical protein Ptr86124_010141 [Pyrenophora tritici-repentis]KAI1668248.1 hypothetical protein L13192_07384 [Pyrenophora tritici-repentis]KAI1681027.1 hypothetical protein KJE20_09878 [Pyrenophora tritici-repentis]